MDEAKIASEDAKRRLNEIETRLGRLDSEIAQMRASAEKDGAAEEVRIRAGAEEDKKKILESAQQEIAAAAKSARRELAAYAADLAVKMAGQRIHVDLPADQALVGSFALNLGKDAQ
jgi:F-type H+-transporting ATPase subunit b